MFFVRVRKDDWVVLERVVEDIRESHTFPCFPGDVYSIEIFDKDGNLLKSMSEEATRNGLTLKLTSLTAPVKTPTAKELEARVIKLVSEDRLDDDLKERLEIIKRMDKDFRFKEDYIRGGRLEQLVFEMLCLQKEGGAIDDVEWRGSLDDLGLPHPAPKGPDLLVYVNDICLVLEVTTIHGIRRQWSAEGASVPDHVLGVAEKHPEYDVMGIFSAPTIHGQLEKNLLSQSRIDGVPIVCLTLEDFMGILSVETKAKFIEEIETLMMGKFD